MLRQPKAPHIIISGSRGDRNKAGEKKFRRQMYGNLLRQISERRRWNNTQAARFQRTPLKGTYENVEFF